MAICNFTGANGAPPRDCSGLQAWLTTLTDMLPDIDQTRYGVGPADPSPADLTALWAGCTPPNGALAAWLNSTSGDLTAWVYDSGSWSEIKQDLCPAYDVRVVPNGTSTSGFNAYWTADGCSGPPDTGAIAVEDGTQNSWYWNGVSWSTLTSGSSGSGSIANSIIRYWGYNGEITITGSTVYDLPLHWYDDNDNYVGNFSTFTYTPQRTGRLRIEAFLSRHIIGSGDRGSIRIYVDGYVVAEQFAQDFEGTFSLFAWVNVTAGTPIDIKLSDIKYPQDERHVWPHKVYIVEF